MARKTPVTITNFAKLNSIRNVPQATQAREYAERILVSIAPLRW